MMRLRRPLVLVLSLLASGLIGCSADEAAPNPVSLPLDAAAEAQADVATDAIATDAADEAEATDDASDAEPDDASSNDEEEGDGSSDASDDGG